MLWDDWRGNPDGESGELPIEKASMLIKRIWSYCGWSIDLHCFINNDCAGCFHTHEAWSFRLVLWGGYIEELESGARRLWLPLMCGLVAPSLSHRVAAIVYHRSYSLWIRSPKRHDVQLRGNGWRSSQKKST